jgi:hypothetical protein
MTLNAKTKISRKISITLTTMNGGFDSPKRRCKALYYKDIRLQVVQNPIQGERGLLAIEVTLSHHKGANKKLKPCISSSLLHFVLN